MAGRAYLIRDELSEVRLAHGCEQKRFIDESESAIVRDDTDRRMGLWCGRGCVSQLTPSFDRIAPTRADYPNPWVAASAHPRELLRKLSHKLIDDRNPCRLCVVRL
uniref:Uncharacterized protein n=1 Tax=Plectus sambesii TaxID=2011161 RepID=A0A914WWK4_9BILA